MKKELLSKKKREEDINDRTYLAWMRWRFKTVDSCLRVDYFLCFHCVYVTCIENAGDTGERDCLLTAFADFITNIKLLHLPSIVFIFCD